MQPAVGGADRAGARAAGAGAAGGAGLLRSARSVAEHRDLAACQQPGGAGRRGAGGPVAAGVWRGRRAAGGGDAGVGVADRLASRAGQHGGAAGGDAGGAAGAGGGAGRYSAAADVRLADGGGSGRCDRPLLGTAGMAAGREALGPVGALLVWMFGLALAVTLTLLALGLSAGRVARAGGSCGRGARYGVSGGRGAAGVGGVARARLAAACGAVGCGVSREAAGGGAIVRRRAAAGRRRCVPTRGCADCRRRRWSPRDTTRAGAAAARPRAGEPAAG